MARTKQRCTYMPCNCSELSLTKAYKLMKVVANNLRSTVQLIEIELSKAYLHIALTCKDLDSEITDSLSLLEVSHYHHYWLQV